MKNFVIAIDGPSASGKGTLAKKLSQHFKVPSLNTGALYRLVAFRIISEKIDPQNFADKIPNLTSNISATELENNDLFTEEVGSIASIIAKNINLRQALFQSQKDFITNSLEKYNGAIIEGRDTTTVICPNADFKFFIAADVEVRAQRRFKQLKEQGKDISYEEILSQLKKRDESDINRADSPLKIAEDAVIIDNNSSTAEETFQKMLQAINR